MKLFYAIYKIWFGIVFLITGIIQYPIYFILMKLNMTRTIFFIKSWFWLPLLHLFGLLFFVLKKPEHFKFPEGPFIICANHTSYLDIIFMYSIIRTRPFIFLGKEELKKFPIIGMFFKTGTMHVAVNRQNKADASFSLKKLGDKIDEGFPVIIFPEGTQSKIAPQLLPFKAGAFKLAIEKQVPIVTMTFCDNFKLLTNPAKLTLPARPGFCRIIIHNPVSTVGMNIDDLLPLQEKIRTLIKDDLRNCGYQIQEI